MRQTSSSRRSYQLSLLARYRAVWLALENNQISINEALAESNLLEEQMVASIAPSPSSVAKKAVKVPLDIKSQQESAQVRIINAQENKKEYERRKAELILEQKQQKKPFLIAKERFVSCFTTDIKPTMMYREKAKLQNESALSSYIKFSREHLKKIQEIDELIKESEQEIEVATKDLEDEKRRPARHKTSNTSQSPVENKPIEKVSESLSLPKENQLAAIYQIYADKFDKLSIEQQNQLVKSHLDYLKRLKENNQLTPQMVDNFIKRIYPLLDVDSKKDFINQIILAKDTFAEYFKKFASGAQEYASLDVAARQVMLDKLATQKSEHASVLEKFKASTSVGKFLYVISLGLYQPDFARCKKADDLAYSPSKSDLIQAVKKVQKGASGLAKTFMQMEAVIAGNKSVVTQPVAKDSPKAHLLESKRHEKIQSHKVPPLSAQEIRDIHKKYKSKLKAEAQKQDQEQRRFYTDHSRLPPNQCVRLFAAHQRFIAAAKQVEVSTAPSPH